MNRFVGFSKCDGDGGGDDDELVFKSSDYVEKKYDVFFHRTLFATSSHITIKLFYVFRHFLVPRIVSSTKHNNTKMTMKYSHTLASSATNIIIIIVMWARLALLLTHNSWVNGRDERAAKRQKKKKTKNNVKTTTKLNAVASNRIQNDIHRAF